MLSHSCFYSQTLAQYHRGRLISICLKKERMRACLHSSQAEVQGSDERLFLQIGVRSWNTFGVEVGCFDFSSQTSLICGTWTMKLFLFPLALKFCESMNVATVFSFLYISSVSEIKGKCATFSGLQLHGRCVFPQSLLLWGYGPSFAQEFLFCFCFTL